MRWEAVLPGVVLEPVLQVCLTILELGEWCRSLPGTFPVALADCGDGSTDFLRSAFPVLWQELQHWITLGSDPALPHLALEVFLAVKLYCRCTWVETKSGFA